MEVDFAPIYQSPLKTVKRSNGTVAGRRAVLILELRVLTSIIINDASLSLACNYYSESGLSLRTDSAMVPVARPRASCHRLGGNGFQFYFFANLTIMTLTSLILLVQDMGPQCHSLLLVVAGPGVIGTLSQCQ